MGLGKPSTKAECDSRIMASQERIEFLKEKIASIPNGKPGSAEACNKLGYKHQLAQEKEELARLKALRKSL